MEIEIRLFATLKDRAQSDRIRVALPADPTTVAALLDAVGADYPALAPALRSALVAVNRAFAGSETPVGSTDEVAIFPPVSGGSVPDQPAAEPARPTYFAVTDATLDIEAIHARLTGPDMAKACLDAFLSTDFGGGRHGPRVDKLSNPATGN